MKLLHVYNKATGAYETDQILFPRKEEIKEMVNKIVTERVEDENGEVSFVDKTYQEEQIVGYKDVYDIPKNATELPLPQPNWKPIFKDGAWVETITKEELDELNKPFPQSPTEFDKLQEQVGFLAKQIADLELGKSE